MESQMFSRSELQKLRQKAKDAADCKGQNPDWTAAYRQLASAADLLDAMMARSTVRVDP